MLRSSVAALNDLCVAMNRLSLVPFFIIKERLLDFLVFDLPLGPLVVMVVRLDTRVAMGMLHFLPHIVVRLT